ncbi:MAG TPA: DMT family transporter [Actinomycetota bacterium]|nr:DMT family transporter [Actinomycetota bacterium]
MDELSVEQRGRAHVATLGTEANRRADLAFLVLLAFIWGTSYLWIKISLRSFTPIQNTAGRLTLGALALLAYCLARRVRLPGDPRVWGHLVVLAVLLNVTPFFLFAYGETMVDSAVAGILNATTPVFTALTAAAAGSERFNPSKLAGLALGFAGAALIFEPWHAASEVASVGGLACLAASACYGVGFVYASKFLGGRGLKPLALSASQLSAAAVIGLAVMAASGAPAPEIRWDAFVALGILGVVGTGAAYVINYRLIVNRGASGAALVTYLIPVVAVAVGAVFLGDEVSLAMLAGTATVLAGVALVRRSKA